MLRLIPATLLLLLLLSPPTSAQCTLNCAGVTTSKPTTSQIVDGLWKSPNFYAKTNLAGTFMGLPVVTFSFYDFDSGPYSHQAMNVGIGEISSETKNVIRFILSHFAWYTAGIYFYEVTEPSEVGQIRFFKTTTGIQSNRAQVVQFPLNDPMGRDSDIALNSAYDNTAAITGFGYGPNSYAYTILQHEIGHALGLDHPGAGDLASWPLPSGHMDTAYTIMKIPITDKAGNSLSAHQPGTPWYSAYSPDDDGALRYLYGCPLYGCSAVDPLR